MTREEAIQEFQNVKDLIRQDGKDWFDERDLELINMAIEALSRPTEWIPCSERLPEENKEVLINLAWGIDIGEYREGGWHSEWINHYDDDSVIAWMPLPEPYKDGDNE